jgi:hypothetical protein
MSRGHPLPPPIAVPACLPHQTAAQQGHGPCVVRPSWWGLEQTSGWGRAVGMHERCTCLSLAKGTAGLGLAGATKES